MKLNVKILLSAALIIGSAFSLSAQDVDFTNSVSDGLLRIDYDSTYRKIEGGLNLNQGSFSSNWTGGGVNSVALGVMFNVLTLDKKGKNSWRNDLQTQYGLVKNENEKSRKNVDRIFYDTKYNRALTQTWSLFANVNFLSQFAKGFEYHDKPDTISYRTKVSSFLSPAYVTEAIGVEYKPVPYFFIDFAPAALRQTIVADKNLYKTFPGNYGVEPGKWLRNEVGIIQLVANFNKDIAKNINFKWRYLLYTSYSRNGATDQKEFAADQRLDAQITAKIAKYFNVNMTAVVLYDKDQTAKIQFAQGLAVGFLYRFK